VGISYAGRTYQEGKKVDWKDGIRAIYAIARYNFFRASPAAPRRKYRWNETPAPRFAKSVST